jgi:hypothetical protein
MISAVLRRSPPFAFRRLPGSHHSVVETLGMRSTYPTQVTSVASMTHMEIMVVGLGLLAVALIATAWVFVSV